MNLAYSAISKIKNMQQEQQPAQNNEQLLRYLAYQAVCDKYSREIAAIQKYIPGWTPKLY